jgi:tartrate dehydrogenase/decarboxylase / D-malate dehydrogenase
MNDSHLLAGNFPASRRINIIDILTAHFVRHPEWFDVVVGSNLFGEILLDLGAAVVGSIGIAPSANLNPPSARAPDAGTVDSADRRS